MKIVQSFLCICISLHLATVIAAQIPSSTLGIVNGRAIILPKPEYPEDLKELCADGKVEVEVSIDEEGHVTKAKAISGDSLLYVHAVKAARKAKFQTFGVPAKSLGIVIYQFISDVRCFDAGVVNKKATFLPKPIIGHKKLLQPQTIKIRVIIDPGTAT